MESPNHLTYLLFTNNYPISRLEVSLLGGLILEKISTQAFIVSFPSNDIVELLRHSSQEIPIDISNTSVIALQNWSERNGWKGLANFSKTG